MTPPSATHAADQLAQAKLFAEVARRVERPADALPPADSVAVALVLWQQAAVCALTAVEEVSAADDDLLVRAAGSPELLQAIQSALKQAQLSTPAEPSAKSALVASLAGFTARLISEIEAPRRVARRERWLRAARYAVPGVLPLLALLSAAVWFARGPNLIAGSTMKLSSQLSSCEKGSCGSASFSTREEPSPWVSYDFGKTRSLHSIVVHNRSDCCWDRALPLLVEVSDDGSRWRELVRTERPFIRFSHDLDAKARYVRLRVARKSYLHLDQVTIR
jgi:hypothetical protein